MEQSRRAVYRVTYPIPERPELMVGDHVFPVIDCSELGLRYEAPAERYPELGATVEGRVAFRRGLQVAVAGEVIRVQDGTVALWFNSRGGGVPFGEILAEQRYLRAKGYVLSE